MDNQEKCLKIWEYDYVNEEYEVWEKRIQVLNTAPELLEACKEALYCLQRLEAEQVEFDSGLTMPTERIFQATYHKLESAIKKATKGE